MKHVLFLMAAYLIAYLLMQFMLPTQQLLLESFSETLSLTKADALLSQVLKYRWVGIALTPVIILLKWLFVTSLLYSALFFAQVETRFKSLWQIALKAEWVFVTAAFIKFLWFYLIASDYTLEDVQHFYPLSAANLFAPSELESWWLYPFQLINVFELIYFIVLAVLLGKSLNISTGKAGEFVLKGYGSGLLLWVLVVVFVTLNFSV